MLFISTDQCCSRVAWGVGRQKNCGWGSFSHTLLGGGVCYPEKKPPDSLLSLLQERTPIILVDIVMSPHYGDPEAAGLCSHTDSSLLRGQFALRWSRKEILSPHWWHTTLSGKWV